MVRVTVPPNPFTPLIVIVDTAGEPTDDDGDVVLIVKSTKLNVAVVVCDKEPLVPVTVTMNVPALFETQDSVAVPEPGTDGGLIAMHDKPVGTVVAESDTVPAKPVPATVMVEEEV